MKYPSSIAMKISSIETSEGDLINANPPPGPRVEVIKSAFLNLKKICSRNSGERQVCSESTRIEMGFSDLFLTI